MMMPFRNLNPAIIDTKIIPPPRPSVSQFELNFWSLEIEMLLRDMKNYNHALLFTVLYG